MKKTKRFICTALFAGLLSACSYLDIVPDMIATVEKNAFSMRSQAEKYFFTCYYYLPLLGNYNQDPAILGGDEIWVDERANTIGGGLARRLALGEQLSASPLFNFWNGTNNARDYYQGISDCNIFLENIGRVPDMTMEERNMWMAEVEVIKVWLHYLLIRAYGPIPIKDKNLSVSDDTSLTHVHRNTLDECVKYCENKINEVLAREHLMEVERDPGTEMGRITKGVALIMKAKMLVTFASPLYNGNRDYIGVKDNRNIEIFNPVKTPEQQAELWQRAADACLDAIQFFGERGKTALYRYTSTEFPTISERTRLKLTIRGALVERWNSDVLWADTRNWTTGGSYQNMQIQSYPRDFNSAAINNSANRNNFAVPIKISDLFHTKNGVPINEDKDWSYDRRFDLRQVDASQKSFLVENETTVNLYYDREPRFYASLGFDRGIWFGSANNVEPGWPLRARQGEQMQNTNNHSWNSTGIWPKKLVHWNTSITATSGSATSVYAYPWPIFRLPDLYLMYAEALNEADNTPAARAKAIEWVDKVRDRAELDGVVESWRDHAFDSSKPASQIGLRDIIQQERMIELMFEGHRFWDLRRWKRAATEYEKPITGWHLTSSKPEEYYRETLVFSRKFSPREYLWPIPSDEILRNKNTLQNYGW